MADASSAVTDPTDWIQTPTSSLQAVDSAVRCQICKDFYTNAVITKCGHSFCSICIRRSLSAEGKCPACRTTESETNLRRNVAMQEIVDAFMAARPQVLQFARAYSAPADIISATQAFKRKRADVVQEDDPRDLDYDYADDTRAQQAPRRSARNRKSSHPSERNSPPNNFKHESEHVNAPTVVGSSSPEPASDDGLVSCPICGRRMKEAFMFDHVGSKACEANQAAPKAIPARSIAPTAPKTKHPTPTPTPPPERLPQLNYSLFNEKQLRQKLSALGIPTSGNKSLLQRRHTEWINIWNSNGDSSRPHTKRELLKELDSWERTQGGFSREANGTSSHNGVMRKDFDGQGWATKNKNDFDDLIAKARASRQAKGKTLADEKEKKGDNDIEMTEDTYNPLQPKQQDPPSCPQLPADVSLSSTTPGESTKASSQRTVKPLGRPETPVERARRVSIDTSANMNNSPGGSPHSPYIPGAGGTDSRRGSASFSTAGFNRERSITAQLPVLSKENSADSAMSSQRSESAVPTSGLAASGIRRQPMFTLPPDPREVTD